MPRFGLGLAETEGGLLSSPVRHAVTLLGFEDLHPRVAKRIPQRGKVASVPSNPIAISRVETLGGHKQDSFATRPTTQSRRCFQFVCSLRSTVSTMPTDVGWYVGPLPIAPGAQPTRIDTRQAARHTKVRYETR